MKFPSREAWDRAHARSRAARRLPIVDDVVFAEHWHERGERRFGIRGVVAVLNGTPVRELNGAELGDQRVRWKPDPPVYERTRYQNARDYADAFAWAARHNARYYGYDQRATPDEHRAYGTREGLKRVLRIAIAATPPGPDRDLLERRLRDLGG